MTDTPHTRRLYRIITTDPPTRDDFLSYNARADLVDRWKGISMYDSEERARTYAERFKLGRQIAILDPPDDNRFRIERTGRRPGHYTVWGDAETLLTLIVATAPV